MLDDITDPYAEIERLQGRLDRLTGKHKPMVRGLNPQESKVARYLEAAGGEWVSNRDALEHLYPGDRNRTVNIIKSFIHNIRVKRPDLTIENQWAYGYRLVPA